MGAVAVAALIVSVATLYLAWRLFRWASQLTARMDTLLLTTKAIGDSLNALPMPDPAVLEAMNQRVALTLALSQEMYQAGMRPAMPEAEAAPEGVSARTTAEPSQRPGRKLMRAVRLAQLARGTK